MKELIKLFLELNPKPSDQQVHALALALGVDKEYLESVFYSMLSKNLDRMESRTHARLKAKKLQALTEDERVLEDDYDDNATPVEDLILNDGEQSDAEDQSIQDSTNDDGTLMPVDDQQVLFNDGELE